jgi:predicted nucleic acid-binding protein
MVKLSKLDDNEILEVYYHVLKYCQIFDEEDIPKNIKTQAINLVADIDPKDAVFLASAIALNAVLWSDDKKLIEGLKIKGVKYVAKTAELIKTL